MKSSNIPFLGYILRAINIIAMLALLFAYLSQYVSPNSIWFLAFFGLSYPIWLFVNIYFVFHWAFNKKLFALFPLLILLLGYRMPGKYFRLDWNDKIFSESKSFKVMTYNVHDFNYYNLNKESGDSAVEMIMEFINANKPDIICFQEFYSNDRKNNFKRFKVFNDYKYYSRFNYNERSKSLYIVIYSKFPILHDAAIVNATDNKDITGIYADINVGEKIVRVFNVHLNSTQISSKAYLLKDEYNVDEKDMIKAATGAKAIAGRLRNGFKKRSLQADLLQQYFESSPYPIVVAGDFNDTPCSYVYRKISSKFVDSFIESGSGFCTTYRGPYPSFRIDYILHDDFILSNSFEKGSIKVSDHYPISCTMNFNKTENSNNGQ